MQNVVHVDTILFFLMIASASVVIYYNVICMYVIHVSICLCLCVCSLSLFIVYVTLPSMEEIKNTYLYCHQGSHLQKAYRTYEIA